MEGQEQRREKVCMRVHVCMNKHLFQVETRNVRSQKYWRLKKILFLKGHLVGNWKHQGVYK